VGFLYAPTGLQPDLSKIDPIKGFKRLFSVNSLFELIKSILKMVIIGFVPYVIIKNEMQNFFMLSQYTVFQTMIYMGKIVFRILFSTGLVLLVLAVFDYAYQRWEYEKGLRMTKQEIKDEFKNTEGDPAIKGRIKRLQREMARKRMMAAVPKADVVVTNPTHLAVALKYDQNIDFAPRVVAKGAGYLAEKIKKIATENDLPLVENKSLAQVLYKMVNVGDLIPENLYRSVAEVLAYVYNLKNRYRGG
jgi:flagellar biosynthetic protein FlhB